MNCIIYSTENLFCRVVRGLWIELIEWLRFTIDEFWSYLLIQYKFINLTFQLRIFFDIVHFFGLWLKFVSLSISSKFDGHHRHLVNFKSIWNHFTLSEQPSTYFLLRMQAKNLTQLLSSNKIVQITWFGVNQKFLLIFCWWKWKLSIRVWKFSTQESFIP